MARKPKAWSHGDESPIKALDITVEIMAGGTVAIAALNDPDIGYITGEAKRAPGDPSDPEIGMWLAAGRVLQAYGRILEETALDISNDNCQHAGVK